MSLILSQPQAEAIYSAMCALKDSGNSYLRVCFDAPHGMRIAASSMIYGVIVSLHGEFDDPTSRAKEEELYYSQSAFATAYGLNSDEQESAPSSYACTFGQRNYGALDGEPQSAVAAAAGGLTQVAIER